MTLKMAAALGTLASLLLLGIGFGVWKAQAEEAHEQPRSNEEQLHLLTTIVEKQATADQVVRQTDDGQIL